MTLPDLSLVMGWVIIGAFLITFIITTLGILRVIRPLYMKQLFAMFIAETFFAAMFLYYKGFETRKISCAPAGVYPFNDDGEPVIFNILQGDKPLKKFDKLPNYKSIPREAEVKNNKLYLKTKKSKIYLGYIDRAREELGDALLTCQTALYLGLYLSEFEHDERRDPHQAVKYLMHVLRIGGEREDKEKEKAIIRLHYLLEYVQQSDDFKLLLRMIDKYRSGYNKYFELAETYLIYAKESDKNQQAKYKGALKYYLLFLSTQASETDKLKTLKDTAKSRVRDLVTVYLAEDEYVRSSRSIILADVDHHNRPVLHSYSQDIAEPDLSKLD